MYAQPGSGIPRHYLQVGERQVHFRAAGAGPPLVLLHQSPTSSAELVTDILALAGEFATFAFDTPGFGLSDPIAAADEGLGPFAVALREVFDVLGLERAHLLGLHTGAMIAAEFASRYPERCGAVVLDGYVVLTPEEELDIAANYFERFPPQRDGGHLPAIWARLRDQALFFPWYRKRAAARMAFDAPDAAALQPYVMDFMRADPAGEAAYKGALSYPSQARASAFATPIWLLNFEQDAIRDQPDRLTNLPDNVQRERLPTPEALRGRAVEICRSLPLPAISAEALETRLPVVTGPRRLFGAQPGQVHAEAYESTSASTLLLLHDAGRSARSLRNLARRLSVGRRVIAPDLPGHGETGPMPGAEGPAAAARVLAEALRPRVHGPLQILAFGASSALALELSVALSGVSSCILVDPWAFPPAEQVRLKAVFAPDTTPRAYGQHLLEAWYFARDSELFWPWRPGARSSALEREPDLDPEVLHASAVDVLKAHGGLAPFVAGALDWDWTRGSERLPFTPLLVAREGQSPHRGAERAAALLEGEVKRLPADLAVWPEILDVWLAQALADVEGGVGEPDPWERA